MKKFITLFIICSSLSAYSKTIWVCDAEVNYSWTNNGWVNGWKSIYEYDNKGDIKEKITYNWINNEWEKTYKSIYEYDIDGNDVQSVSYNKSGNDWIKNAKTIHTYDSNGNQTQEIIYNWRDNCWVESLKYIYEYDNNKMTRRICYSWNNGWNKYMENKYETEYDNNGNLTQLITYKNNNGWEKSTKTTYEYKIITIEDVHNNTEPITDVTEKATTGINIYLQNGIVVVENANAKILVYDAMGRLVYRNNEKLARTELQINGTGVYIVKVGNVAKRVMVN
ncbi:MAG: T9SS type A sorting domain-containing protein [Salinivirgaceae bacterium]|nr:T9SS type A sorting domain-containing protein [Salinivirgaceae bacterium]